MSSLIHPFSTTFCDGEVQTGHKIEHTDFGGRKLKKTKTSVGRGAVLGLPVVLRLHQCLMRTMWRPPHAKAGYVPSAQPLGDTSFLQKDTWETSASAKESPCA